MKVGSLVECLDNDFAINASKWPNLPKRGNLYTVREKRTLDGIPGVLLEELTNPYYAPGKEYGFYQYHFREAQPPMDVSALFEKQLKVTS